MRKQNTGFFQPVFGGFSFAEKIALSVLGAFVLFAATQPFFAYAVSANPGDIIISEFSSASDTEWVELLNMTDAPVSLDGWTIQDFLNPAKPLSGLGTIPAHGIVVFENSSGWLNNKPDTETITLFDGAGASIHSVTYGSDDGVSVAAPKKHESAAFDASTQVWSINEEPSKGWFNNAEDIGCGGSEGDSPSVAPTLSSIADCLSNEGINSNIGELENPSATPLTEDGGALYFRDDENGSAKIVFEQTLNLTDEAVVDILRDLGEAMKMSAGHIKLSSEIAKKMAVTGAKIYMYGLNELGFTSKPNLIVKEDEDEDGDEDGEFGEVINPGDPDYPTIVSEYDGEEGTLTFTTDHFTQFEVEKGIFGTKWNDANGDGVRNWNDANENGEKDGDEEYTDTEPGLAGWTIVAYNDDMGSDQEGYETETVTDADGNYSFTDLDDGEYVICEVKKFDDWTQTYPNGDGNYNYVGCDDEYNEGNEPYGYHVEIGDVVNVSNLDFGNRQSAHIVVRKITYPESGEEFNFAVDRRDDDGEIDNGHEEFSLAHGGEGRTIDVVPGTYHVKEDVPPDWKLAHVFCEYDGNAVGEDISDGKTVTVGAGDTVTCIFTDIDAGLTVITGYKWEDINGDGVKDEGEPGKKDWNIALGRVMPRDTGAVTIPIEIVALSLTGSDGWYYLPVAERGEYKIFEEKRSGWNTTSPAAIDSFFDITYRIDVSPQPPLAENSFFDVFFEQVNGQVITHDSNEHPLDFGNFKHGKVIGYKWEDSDSDGEWDKGEEGKDGWTMALGRILPSDTGAQTIPIEIVAMTLTGEGGVYSLSANRPGEYKIFEEKREGWSATNPAGRADSFFDISYDLKAIAIGDPDFDLLRVTGDPDFDLLRSSFFDVFVEFGGQEVNQSRATEDGLLTIPGVPLQFGNHKLLIINKEEIVATEVKETSTVITWTTDFPGTSRVVYGTVSVPVLGAAPNYGYANSTVVSDEDPKVTNHSVSISGLDSGSTYYYRTISAASPESVSGESSFSTPTPVSSGVSGGGGGGGGSSGGGGGGGGGGIVILPGTSQPESNQTAQQQQQAEEPAGDTLAAVTLSGSALSGGFVVPPEHEALSGSEESGAPAEQAEGSSDGVSVGSAISPEPLVFSPTPEASPEPESESFLAAAITALSFGTGSTAFASGIALVVLGLLGYGIYWMNQKRLFR